MSRPDYLERMRPIENPNSKIKLYYDPTTSFLLYYFDEAWTPDDLVHAFDRTKKLRDEIEVTNTFLYVNSKIIVQNVMQFRSILKKNGDEKGYLPMYIESSNRLLRIFVGMVCQMMPQLTVEYVVSYIEAVKKAEKSPNKNNREQS